MTGGLVLDESMFLEGNVFNDDRSDFKTKNHKFPAKALLQRNFWVSCASRASPNSGDVVHNHLGKDMHHMVPTMEAGKTIKRWPCFHGIMDLTGETDTQCLR